MGERTLGAELRRVREIFSRAGIEAADLDARLIVEYFSGTTRTDAISNPQHALSSAAYAAIENAVARRLDGEPLHRILGFREFYGLHFALSPQTLEPRPDTETLVDALLPTVRRIALEQGQCRLLDLGTGTGAIALALLHSEPRAVAAGADISEGALATALSNATRLGLEGRFTPVLSSWFSKIEGQFDVIVSNPPYIRSAEIEGLEREVRDFDPRAALDGGIDGLDAYREIAAGAGKHLTMHGRLALEIGFDQADEVGRIFENAGFELVSLHKDLGGNDRVLLLQHGSAEK